MRQCLPLLTLLGLLLPAALPAADREENMTIEEYLQKLSTVPDVVNRKDPFIPAAAPFEVPRELTPSNDGINMSAPVMERYPLKSYEVVATLLGDQYPRALVRLPKEENNKVVIVREREKLGNKGGVIKRIIKEGVSVSQKTRSPLGFIDNVETLLRVGMSERQREREEKNKESPEIRQGMPAPTLSGAASNEDR